MFDPYLRRRRRAGEHADIADHDVPPGPAQHRRWRAGEREYIGDDSLSAPPGPMARRRQRAGEYE